MELKIIPYRKEHHEIFRQLNLNWLDHYNLTESHDLIILDDPEGTVIDKGGFIWMAEADGKIVGSLGLAKEKDGVYELVKFAVAADHHGKGIGKMLLETCLTKARELGAAKIFLLSNHQLQTAIGLYEKFGFYHTPVVDSPLETADVRMELML